MQEVAVLATCRSPHLTSYLGCQLVPETTKLHIIMEYMGGGSIADLVRPQLACACCFRRGHIVCPG